MLGRVSIDAILVTPDVVRAPAPVIMSGGPNARARVHLGAAERVELRWPARVGDLPSAPRPIGQATHQRAPRECVLGDEVVDPGEIIAPLVHFCASGYSRRRHGRRQRAKALGLAPPLQEPARKWSDCHLSGEPGSSGPAWTPSPSVFYSCWTRGMTCEQIALILSA